MICQQNKCYKTSTEELELFKYLINIFPCRYKVIVYSSGPNRNSPKLWATVISLVAIWVTAMLLSSPLFVGMEMEFVGIVHDLNRTMGPMVADCVYSTLGKKKFGWVLDGLSYHILIC